MTEITKSTEAKKDEMQVEKEKLESVKRADAAVKTMHDFTSPEVLYKELINLQNAGDQLEEVMGKRTRAIERKLRQVEALPAEDSQRMLSLPELTDDEDDE